MNLLVVCILVYVLLQLAIGYWASRGIKTEQDYLLAGRNLGPGLTLFTVFATWFGAETCVGSAGEAYAGGLAAVTTDPFGYALGILVAGLFFAAPLWRRKLTTLADLFRERYGVGVERLAAILMVPTSLLWAAAQIRAFGQVLTASSDLEVNVAITVATAVVVIYTTLGGMLADALSDLLQGVVLIVGLVALGAIVLVAGGGWEKLGALSGEATRLVPAGQPWLATLEAWAIPVLGTVAAQEMISRIISARSPTIASRATVGASFLYLAVGLIPVGIGLVGPQLVGALEHPEQVLMHVAQQNLGTVLYIVFVGALVSAILSTVNSALLVAGALTAHNLVIPLMPRMDERHRLRFDRAAVVVFGLVAYVLALTSEGVYALVEEASSLGSAGVLVCMLFALWGRRIGSAASAIAALVAGIAVYVGGQHLFELPYPYLTSLAAAFCAYLVAAPFGIRHSGQDRAGVAIRNPGS
ncbi:MAG TPA: sodium:solute symporter family protein [Nevskiales bacterium]|nr:sodium:solute symporter family protein [Nevskiales bacterium]